MTSDVSIARKNRLVALFWLILSFSTYSVCFSVLLSTDNPMWARVIAIMLLTFASTCTVYYVFNFFDAQLSYKKAKERHGAY